MFGIKSKTRCIEEARLYAENILSDLNEMIGRLNSPQDQALAEIFGGIYLLYLARESADFKHIRPYLADAFLDQTKYFRCAPADREKRVRYINACWDAYEQSEKSLLRRKENPVDGLLHSTAAKGLAELLESDAAYPALWKRTVNLVISRRKLKSYASCAYSKRRITLAGAGMEPTEYLIIDTIAYQNETYVCLKAAKGDETKLLRVLLKPDGTTSYVDPGPVVADVVMELAKKRNPLEIMPGSSPRTITLKNEKGENVVFEVMDIIPYQGRTFVCLLGRGDEMLTILETKDEPGGSASYTPAEDPTAEAVFNLFKERNPNMVG